MPLDIGGCGFLEFPGFEILKDSDDRACRRQENLDARGVQGPEGLGADVARNQCLCARRATVCAAWMPAPCAAFRFYALSCAVNWPVSVSNRINFLARPK